MVTHATAPKGKLMILIFDTNAVRMLNPESGNADLLRIFKTSGKAKVAIPEMVLQEMIAQQIIEYREAYSIAESAVRRANGRHPGRMKPIRTVRPDPDLDLVRSEWNKLYREIFEIIPTTGEMALRALLREANGEKPAKMTGKANERKKEGARDVAIWLSITHYMRKNPDEIVCFVTKNSKDFGDGKIWPTPMDRDLEGMEDRISVLEDMDAVISSFTEEVPAQDLSEGAHSAVLDLAPAMGEFAIRRLKGTPRLEGSLLTPMEEGFGTLKRVGWRRWVVPPEVALIDVANVTGHKIGEEVWFTASVEWLLWGLALSWNPSQGILPIACVWQTRMLMSMSGEAKPTILSGRPVVDRLSSENESRWAPAFDQVQESMRNILSDSEDDGDFVTEQLLGFSMENRHIMKNLRSSMHDPDLND
ncbi:PIN domain-containing protein [Streptomyces clavifer]|uniref:PIN domain-containing protein n=1 Tax=Streptomyces clavifer TaxID=68188 RepID=UPI0033B55F63